MPESELRPFHTLRYKFKVDHACFHGGKQVQIVVGKWSKKKIERKKK